MSRRIGIMLFFMLPQSAMGLEFQHIEAAEGPFGPKKTDLTFFPYDEVVLRFQIVGAKLNDAGRCEGVLSFRLYNASGKKVLEDQGPLGRQLMLGGDRFPAHLRINVGPLATPGEYRVVVTFEDKLSQKTARFERTITFGPLAFAIVRPRFSHDAAGKVPTSAAGLVGEVLHFHMLIVGFERQAEQIRLEVAVELLDAAGKRLLTKPQITPIHLTDAKEIARLAHVTFRGGVALNRSGEFRVRVRVKDLLGNQQTQYETALVARLP